MGPHLPRLTMAARERQKIAENGQRTVGRVRSKVTEEALGQDLNSSTAVILSLGHVAWEGEGFLTKWRAVVREET